MKITDITAGRKKREASLSLEISHFYCKGMCRSIKDFGCFLKSNEKLLRVFKQWGRVGDMIKFIFKKAHWEAKV